MRHLAIALALFAAIPGFCGEPTGTSDKLGKVIEPVLNDGANPKTKWADVRGEKATVVFFLSFDCPNSTGYTPTILSLFETFNKEKIKFVGVCESEHSVNELKAKVAEFKFPFPVFADPGLRIADAFKATVTPEAMVLDHNSVLRYRGRIDNTYQARLKKNPVVDQHDLANALKDLVAGKPIQTPVTKAVGCGIGVKELTVKGSTKLTYHKDIAPILQMHCQGCHRPGEVGPFSLMSYKQAVNWAQDIKDYTIRREMPPWKPTVSVAFHNDRRMPDGDIKKIAEWVDGGTPEGNVADAPPPVKTSDGWALGKPDLILETGEYHLGPSGNDSFRCFVMPTNLMEDKHIIGFEVKPGNPQIVHHTLNYWDITGKAREMEAKTKAKASPDDRDRGPGYSASMGVGFFPTGTPRPGTPPIGNFGGWAPGQISRFLPEGTGYLLPKGADVVVQVHYHRNGKAEKDNTKIALYFAKKKIEQPYQTATVGAKNALLMFIPPNKDDYKAQGTAYLHTDATLHSVMPHMHLIGKSVKMTLTPPGGQPITLVDIQDWDYNWQETYWLKEPMKLKAGTKLEIEAVFDNSTRNPNNPRNPPAYVMFGEQTHNEMLFGFFGMTGEPGKFVRARQVPPPASKPKP